MKSQEVIIVKMKDLAALFKAFVMPYLAVYFGSCVGFMVVTGQEVPIELWVLFSFPLGEMGIHWSISKVVNK